MGVGIWNAGSLHKVDGRRFHEALLGVAVRPRELGPNSPPPTPSSRQDHAYSAVQRRLATDLSPLQSLLQAQHITSFTFFP